MPPPALLMQPSQAACPCPACQQASLPQCLQRQEQERHPEVIFVRLPAQVRDNAAGHCKQLACHSSAQSELPAPLRMYQAALPVQPYQALPELKPHPGPPTPPTSDAHDIL